jgi:TIR domain-containing protein
MSASTPGAAGRVFISYRREETAYPAGWLFDRLADHLGAGQVFKDVDSIQLGDDFVEVITTAVGSCDVLLALIGDEWLTITDEDGRRRLDSPEDFVRLEIETALTRNVLVIPILVEGARMPRADELPASLAKLVRRQALELSPSRFDFDTSQLLRVLDRTLTRVRAGPAATDPDATLPAVSAEHDADIRRGSAPAQALEDAAATSAPTAEPSDPSSEDTQKTPEDREHTSLASAPGIRPVGSAPRTPSDSGKSRDRQGPRISSAGGAVMGPAAAPRLPLADAGHRAAAQGSDDRRLVVAGELAIVGAALLVVGLFPGYEWNDSLWTGRRGESEMRWFALYALILAALVVGAGACTLLPRTRRLIGPGLLLGIVTASTWGLLYLPSNRIHLSGTPFDGGWWFELVAHLVLVAAACLAGLVLVRTADVHLTRRRPQSQLPWLVALLGGAGALALFFHDKNLWYVDSQFRWYAVPSIWVTVLALVVPACAAVAVPRRFGVALLAGWIAGGADLFGVLYLWDRYQENGNYGTTAIITFGFTLLALVPVAVLFARAAPGSEAERAVQGPNHPPANTP